MLVLVHVTSDFVLISVISQGFLTSNEIIGTMLISRSKKKKKKEKYRSDRITPVKDVPLETLQIFISICKYRCNLIVNIISFYNAILNITRPVKMACQFVLHLGAGNQQEI
ncbi:uncharacterized protein LOC117206333 [Bombus bifarius]|uniref:Uncharacterized protein LOC117206333 n=1 Tax=Bombus bifarius TaxID=103933 RepID=A0A6P8LLU8_9HYME|nr:uncharacterized protein LOC117206333 [Bombus bifarius]